MAIASLILGIVAFPTMCCTYGVGGVAFGVTALILGRVAISKIRAANGMLSGYGLAQAGWICGLVGAILGVLLGIFQVLFLILGATGHLPNSPPFGTFTPFPTSP